MDINRSLSFTAANSFPAKLFHNNIFDQDGRIVPYHIQLSPTNKCNLNCSWCSCSNRDKNLCLSYTEIKDIINEFSDLGTKSVTITGGGEPLLHPNINGIIESFSVKNIKIGIVTNGISILNLENDPNIVWIRISFSDTRNFSNNFLDNLRTTISDMSNIDWSFSYVLTKKPNYDNLKEILNFAQSNNFCHIRLVSDLFEIENVPIDEVKKVLQGIPGEDLVIYQGRKEFGQGHECCLLSLLKPVIGTDGGIWPCCGVQYALKDISRDFEELMRMGHWTAFRGIMQQQKHFNGLICKKCYYIDYNNALAMMASNLIHKEFL